MRSADLSAMLGYVRVRHQILTATAAGALGLGGIAVSAVPSAAQQPSAPAGQVRLMASSAVPPPPGSVRLGTMPAGTRLRLDVTLRVPHPAALAAFIADVNDRRSPLFGHFLRRGQFGPRFGPAPATIAAVRAALRGLGLSPGPTSPDRLSIPVTASAATAERAFGTSLISYRLPGGRIAYANSAAPRLPASIVPLVAGVLGLSSVYLDRATLSAPPMPLAASPRPAAGRAAASRAGARADAAGPQPCSSIPKADVSHAISTFAERYRMSPLYSLGDLGSGVRVAVFEQEPDLPGDISAYETCFGVDTAVSYHQVDGGAGTGPGDGQAALDIENIIGLSPGVTLDVYQGPNDTSGNAYDIYHAIVMADQDQVVSTSWGTCEAATDPSLISSEQALFDEAGTQDQTVVAAAGDSGSTACYQSDPSDDTLGVQNPASQPGVVAVGGTTITPSADAVWNDSGAKQGAGGGGLSSVWCMPGYQDNAGIPGLISADSRKAACTTAAGTPGNGYLRQLPDVSAPGSPQAGYLTYFNGHWAIQHGTGGAAPLWAAVAALTDASPFCTVWGDANVPGTLPQGLYFLAANFTAYVYGAQPEGLQDVTQGSNDYTPSGYKGGLYPATTGFDLASGLGTPLVSGINRGRASTFYPGLAALMCLVYASPAVQLASVSSVSPRFGPRHGKQQVTVTGSGFLPIAGADFAQVGKTYVAATCSSTTTCTFSTPKGALGPTDIKINSEDLGPSKATKADRYQYVAAPKISSLSPSHGPAHGRTTVTIRGSGFYGLITVRFGKKLGTHVKVKSSRKLTVTAPAGSGPVKVIVTAAGGSSPAGFYSY
jgi:subtilase family serine protease